MRLTRMKNIGVLVVVLGFVALQSCKDKNPVVLTINDKEFRKDELKEMIDYDKNKYESMTRRKFMKHEFDSCVNTFVDDQIFYQFVNREGYDKHPDVVLTSTVMNKAMLAQVESDLYQEIITKKMKIDYADIEVGRERSLYNYTFQWLTFASRQQMVEILGADTICKDSNDFKKVVARAAVRGVSNEAVTCAWPFGNFVGMVHQLENLRQGQVTKPSVTYSYPYGPQYSMVCLIKKEPIANRKKDDVKDDYLYNVFQEYTKRQMFNSKLYGFYKTSKYTLVDSIIERCYKTITYNGDSEIDTNSVRQYLNTVVLQYTLSDTLHTVNIRDFVNFHKNLLIKRKFSSLGDFREYFIDMVVFDYLWAEADSIGFLHTRQSIQNRTSLQNRIAADIYLDDKVYNNIKVTDNDVNARYTSDSARYTRPELISYDLLVFKTYEDAYRYFDSLSINAVNNVASTYNGTLLPRGLVEVKKGNTYSPNKTSINTRENPTFQQLVNSKFTNVFPSGKYMAMAVKSGISGTFTIPLNQVRQEISERIENERKKDAREKLLEVLKKETKYKINAKYSDYFN